jgi:exonuclease III
MCNKAGQTDQRFIRETFETNPYCSYNFYHQSVSNKRGVGILVKKTLNFVCLDTERDQISDNYLLIRAQVNGTTVILGSIYGPNTRDDDFFDRLQAGLNRFSGDPVILGGDFNCTVSCLPVRENPDVMNMAELPNLAHSRKLREICNRFDLTDPFRALFPERIDFSYAPWGNLRSNRSRIDFFLVSSNIVEHVSECYIKNSVQSRLFDHKAIFLSFAKVRNLSSRPSISKHILRDPDLEIIVKLATLECYVHAAVNQAIKNRLLTLIGRGFKLIRDAGPDPSHIEYSFAELLDIDERTTIMNELRRVLLDLDDENIQDLAVNIDADDFMEYLMNNVRNEVISYQSFIRKKVNESLENLNEQLKTLKLAYKQHFDEISRLELKLRDIQDLKNNAIIESSPNFATLNGERITPFFLKMARGSLSSSSMTEICDYDGNIFENSKVQKTFIREHFANSYKKPENEPENMAECIANFLGRDILAHPLVADLKLSQREKESLEGNLTMDELDKALEGANLNSASGIDGYSTRFIKKFWFYFRKPLLNYTETVFEKRLLTNSFKTAVIKLIPKKGNAKDIKKWRPISLLSCMYKIISRAVNNRLKSVINRFMSRAQKGFTNHRYIQEVLINVCETISHCQVGGVGGALLSIDQTRAFDTISHKYMTEVYRFFNFGENFITQMDTIGTGRNASILFEDGTISENFDLGTGRPQGDGPSPLQYNMGEQIVLLKIELDPEVASVFQHALAPRFNMDLIPDPRRRGVDAEYNTHLAQESNRETDKADSFADDNSTATLAEFASLNKLKQITVEFSSFSGLQSNAEKTTLLKIGTADVLPNEILDIGFNVVDEVTLLGLTVNRNLSSLTVHFDEIAGKVSRMIEHWDRFRLSLPGRISICKTFMLSQIGYLGSILTPSNQQINRLQKLMDDFCMGTLRVAKKKLYLPPSEGGLGLICLKEYITAIQCAWIKRVTQHWGDNWRFDLKLACYGNPLIADSNTFDRHAHPVLYNICESFGKFRSAFTSKDDNYKKAYIFKNPFFRRGRNDNGILCENFFGARGNFDLCAKLAKLKFEDFFIRGGPKSLADLNNDYDLNFSLVTYMRLHEALGVVVNNNRGNEDKPTMSLEFFVRSFEKGSRPFRRILCYNSLKR